MKLKFSNQLDFEPRWIKNNSSEQEMFHFWIFQIESISKFAESASFSSCTCSPEFNWGGDDLVPGGEHTTSKIPTPAPPIPEDPTRPALMFQVPGTRFR